LVKLGICKRIFLPRGDHNTSCGARQEARPFALMLP
jgi:hypothetical protein